MNDVLKQRLVGALILVALGVVFWPIIFVEPGDRDRADDARMPPRPAVVTTSIEPPDLAGLRPSEDLQKAEMVEPAPAAQNQLVTATADSSAAANAVTEVIEKAQPVAPPKPTVAPDNEASSQSRAAPQASPKMSKTRTEAPVKPKIDADGIPVTWILRVASLSSGEKGDELRQRLLKMGHKAYRQKVKSGGKTLYRVYVGPKVERAKLEKVQGQIDAEFGVSTMITRYYP